MLSLVKMNFKKVSFLSLIAGFILFFLSVSSVGAVDVLQDACANNPSSAVCAAAKGDDLNVMIENITNTMLFLLGATAVIAIIVGGFMYVTAAGDAGKVKTAKNTVLYAVIGLVVALLAWGIVKFTVESVV